MNRADESYCPREVKPCLTGKLWTVIGVGRSCVVRVRLNQRCLRGTHGVSTTPQESLEGAFDQLANSGHRPPSNAWASVFSVSGVPYTGGRDIGTGRPVSGRGSEPVSMMSDRQWSKWAWVRR
jgi:hypothetical protein